MPAMALSRVAARAVESGPGGENLGPRALTRELDRAPGHLGDGRDLLARGQGLRAGEEVPVAEAQGVGEVFVAEHVELGDLVGVGGRQRSRVGDAGQGGVGGLSRPPAAL